MPAALRSDARSFPVDPPPDPDRPQAVVAHDWDAFAALARMTDHWDRPGWTPGHRAYYWMLLPRSPELTALTRHCQHHLAPLRLDPVPDDGLHITLGRIGHRTDVTPRQAAELARTVAEHAPRAFALSAHPMTGSRGAVRYSLTPWTPLLHLHTVLNSAARRHGLPAGRPTAGFRPHLGIAYNNRDRDARPVIDAVAALRTLPPVTLRIARVELVELRRESTAYRWTRLHTARLPAPAVLPRV
ncbi:2'-5' RNA ligase family protein [Streptomyces yaizuensis]|uniref:2'-5' RNA ligase family protein n=1 Tax=Streptomyces yaizuensis TaxID=2989713 RepID=A0ABQ5P6E1_9ACTN|nr:2'-5' RNA ligase family protein [Streptomyces sp. YSPA8]GLF98145.1 2'-5' RNA ligase family protein [Streptomyces sp. YSPA8]